MDVSSESITFLVVAQYFCIHKVKQGIDIVLYVYTISMNRIIKFACRVIFVSSAPQCKEQASVTPCGYWLHGVTQAYYVTICVMEQIAQRCRIACIL